MERTSKRVSKPSFLAQQLKEDLFSKVKPLPKHPLLGKREYKPPVNSQEDKKASIALKKVVVQVAKPVELGSEDHTTVATPALKPVVIPSPVFKVESTTDDESNWPEEKIVSMAANMRAKSVMGHTDIRSKALIAIGKWAWENGEMDQLNKEVQQKEKMERLEVLANEIANSKDVKVPDLKFDWLQPNTNHCDFLKNFSSLIGNNTPLSDDESNLLQDKNAEEFIIVDNQNNDLVVKVQDPKRTLMLSTDWPSHQPSNSLNTRLRECLFNSVPFMNLKVLDDENLALQSKNDDMPKRHLIKQKQVQANFRLKRTFGISYVKQRESKQAGVSSIFKTVPPLVIQCSTMIDPFTEVERPALIQKCKFQFSNFFNGSDFWINTMPAIHETCFRDYLLDLANSNLGLIKDSPVLPEGTMTLKLQSFSDLKYLLSQNRAFVFLLPSLNNLQMVCALHVKKSINSKKAYLSMLGRDSPVCEKIDLAAHLKSVIGEIKAEMTSEERAKLAEHAAVSLTEIFETSWLRVSGDAHDIPSAGYSAKEEESLAKLLAAVEGLNFNTLSIKFEVYVPESSWKSLQPDEKKEMTTYVHLFKKTFDQQLLQWALARIDIKDCSMDHLVSLIPNLKVVREPNFDLKLEEEKVEIAHITKEDLKSIVDTSSSNYSLPLYTVDTRDCFSFDPIVKESKVIMRGREVTKKEYFFEPDQLPSNFDYFKKRFPDGRIGVVTYEGFFSHEELLHLEHLTHMTELEFFKGSFLPHTGQVSMSGKRVKRTKFFFGSRYMWSALQIHEPHANLAGGIRTDVSPIPGWMIDMIEKPLVECGIVPKDFINSLALNVYHDGEEGLGQHFDDAIRFRQVVLLDSAYFFIENIFRRSIVFRQPTLQLLQRSVLGANEQRLHHGDGRRLLCCKRHQALHQAGRHDWKICSLHSPPDASRLCRRRPQVRPVRRPASSLQHAQHRRAQCGLQHPQSS